MSRLFSRFYWPCRKNWRPSVWHTGVPRMPLPKLWKAARRPRAGSREAIAAKQARKLAQAPRGLAEATTTRRKAPVGLDTYAERRANNTVRPAVRERRETAAPKIVNDRARMIPARRLGQLAIDGDQKSEIVERRKLRSTGLVTDTSMGRTLRKRGRGRLKGSKNRPKP